MHSLLLKGNITDIYQVSKIREGKIREDTKPRSKCVWERAFMIRYPNIAGIEKTVFRGGLCGSRGN